MADSGPRYGSNEIIKLAKQMRLITSGCHYVVNNNNFTKVDNLRAFRESGTHWYISCGYLKKVNGRVSMRHYSSCASVRKCGYG